MAKSKRKDKTRRKKAKKKERKGSTMAEKADRHVLYQESVQCAEAELDFVDETFKTLRGRRAKIIREDFCGTAHVASEWVKRRRDNRAIAVDLDPEVLGWGAEHNVAPLGEDAERVLLLNQNVLDVETEPLDAVLAMNFSYWILMDRDTMRRYFRRVRQALVDDGVLFLDSYGGYDAYRELRERTKLDGFTYVWDQEYFDPISAFYRCHIHFHFPDGSKLRNAYSYEWRLWTLPELRELLEEAGFSRSTVYWQGEDEETGEGDGEFAPVEHGDADAAWIVYLVAEK